MPVSSASSKSPLHRPGLPCLACHASAEGTAEGDTLVGSAPRARRRLALPNSPSSPGVALSLVIGLLQGDERDVAAVASVSVAWRAAASAHDVLSTLAFPGDAQVNDEGLASLLRGRGYQAVPRCAVAPPRRALT